jgi:hypothetical protein
MVVVVVVVVVVGAGGREQVANAMDSVSFATT